MSFIVEYAKSGRSACKHCKVELAKGEMRIGIVSKGNGGFNMTSWHHSKCIVDVNCNPSNLLKAKGYTALKDADQSLLKNLLQSFETGSQNRKRTLDGTLKPLAVEAKYNKEAWQDKLNSFAASKLTSTFMGATLPKGWKCFESIIFNQLEAVHSFERVAAFDFDGCLANTNVKISGADAWSLLYPSIPLKLQNYHKEGYKLVIFTNESNITGWTKSRQKAVDSKLGRLEGFLGRVEVPIQVLVACAKEGTGDPCRKPAPGMWEFMERHLNGNTAIAKSRSLYVGDAAGRVGDYSAADLGFAKAVGVPFSVPEAIFEDDQ